MWWRQGDLSQRRILANRLSHHERAVSSVRHNARDRLIPVVHDEVVAFPNGPEVLAEAGLELGNSHAGHSHKIVINGHIRTVIQPPSRYAF